MVAMIPPKSSPLSNFRGALNSRCTGIALANTIDILRIRQYWDGLQGTWDKNKKNRVSSQMLYKMGQAFDELVDEEQLGSTLRGVLRGFKQNGVCLREGVNEDNDTWTLTISRCKEARQIILGGYARLQPRLLDYQTALKEIGVVLVSARTHSGWNQPQEGEISYDQGNIDNWIGHAFVLVGYTSTGFLVLNSRGSEWGQWIDSSGKLWRGVAVWKYEDWYDNILDAWIIRLGVPYGHLEK